MHGFGFAPVRVFADGHVLRNRPYQTRSGAVAARSLHHQPSSSRAKSKRCAWACSLDWPATCNLLSVEVETSDILDSMMRICIISNFEQEFSPQRALIFGIRMTTALSIEHAHKRNLKQSVKEFAGQAVATFAPQKAKQLFESPLSQPSGLYDKLIMAYLKRRAMLEKQEDFFERLHIDFWQGNGGAVFSNNCDHRFEDLFLAKQKEDFDRLRSIWESQQPQHIVEFGCNSGLLLQYMTTELSGVKTSTGIEINAEQVCKNQESSKFDSRIQFSNADGGEWLFENGKANSLFVSNGGVLEYFRRERLNEMLTHISSNLGPAIFFAVEPVADDHDWSKTTESIPFGEELSFSHNYTDLFESNGFQVVHQRSVEFDLWRMMATIAVAEGES